MLKYSPMMEQYLEIKEKYRDCLVLFRLGDFYELFFDDALTASQELGLTLTGRDCGQENRAPMCGVPYHSAEGYIARLIQKGYKVAVCEQVEDPKTVKTIVKREVVRIVTPGTMLDPNALDETKNNYLACIYEDKSGFGLAVSDITTGELTVTSIVSDQKDSKLIDELARFDPSEIISNDGFSLRQVVESIIGRKAHSYAEWSFHPQNAKKRICEQFGVHNLTGYGIEGKPLEIAACGALLQYLYDTQKNSLRNITSIREYRTENYMTLDISSRRNLELTETVRDKTKKHSLLWVLDKTKTSMGARLIRKWIEQPLISVENINKRLDMVGEMKDNAIGRAELREILNTVYDIERIVGKIVYKTANGRDLTALKKSVEHFPYIKSLLNEYESPLAVSMKNSFDDLSDIYAMVDEAINEDCPLGIREGRMIKPGYSEKLEGLRDAKTHGTEWLSDLESRERELTGIKNLKIKYNKIFGYCIEITNSNKDQAPGRYVRRQTLSNCERYTTEELKKIEEEILGADEKIIELEYEIFMEIIEKLNVQISRVQLSTDIVAVLDVLQSFAETAEKSVYCRPHVDNGNVVKITEGRHPVVEEVSENLFIANDTDLDTEDNRLAIITGPNMAGKSTYMRQVALIVLMAQIGSFVPAERCRVGVVDRIFTRVGASDDLATGQSTFMVEMSEVANILNNATCRSLIILDEIGRGTSTFDGLSIAWSVLEYIADRSKLGAKTLFSTHYHELTELEGRVPGVKNYCMTVMEKGEDIIFLRKLARGGADHSYGIHVAKLAGIPSAVLSRSREIFGALNRADILNNQEPEDDEETENIVYYGKRKAKDEVSSSIINELCEMEIENMNFLEVMDRMYDIRSKIRAYLGRA